VALNQVVKMVNSFSQFLKLVSSLVIYVMHRMALRSPTYHTKLVKL